MKKTSLLFLLFSLIPFWNSLQSQTTTTIDNKVILAKYNATALLLHDYDNEDNLWFSLRNDTSSIIYQVDDNLNIIQTIENEYPRLMYFKLNDKFYGTGGYLRMAQIDQYYSDLVVDSMKFFSNDINGNELYYKLFFSCSEDTNRFYNINTCFLTKDNNIGILLNTINKTTKVGCHKLIIIDTLGEIKSSKLYDNIIIPKNYSYSSKIYETDSNFIINHSKSAFGILKDSVKAYYINKNTLDIIDSNYFDSAFFLDNQKKINDSIIITISQYGARPSNEPERFFINIINDKKREIISRIKVEYGGSFINEDYIPDYQERVDFRNQDSIYYCCFVRNSDGFYYSDYSGFIQIVNFGIDGNLNFDYRFRYDSVMPKQINGVKATSDGGLLVAVQIFNDCWIMKFMPNGVVGLTNVETQEKESIKVYPNPAKDYVNVDIECTNFKESDIELLDMQGRIVKTSKLKAKQGNRVDVSSLSSGAYSYNVSLNGKTISGKIIIGK